MNTNYTNIFGVVSLRRGVTLIEVAFAMGIILIGLVGLISVIPVAGRQAKDAVSLNSGTALATAGFAEFQARNYLDEDSWVLSTDFAFTDTNTVTNYVEQSVVPLTVLESVFGTGTSSAHTGAVCIDPLFVAHRPGYLAPTYNTYSAVGTHGHRRIRFPYYKVNYNPLANPSEPVTNANQWPAMPRMTRVSINRGTAAGAFISGPEAELLSESGDEINVFQTTDRSLPAALQGQDVTGNGMGYGKVQTSGRYSWIATVSDLPGTDYANVSVAVIEDRDRSFFTFPNDGTTAEKPEENAVDERVAYVNFAGGFVGGAGGTVEILLPVTVDPSVIPGQWVMLSRNVWSVASPAFQYSVHRWYRVLGVIGEPFKLSVTDPVNTALNHEVWQQRLMLDGPDWSFGFATPGFASDEGTGVVAVRDNTVMTILQNVVSVTEKTIRKPK